jgi:hypothetical protein
MFMLKTSAMHSRISCKSNRFNLFSKTISTGYKQYLITGLVLHAHRTLYSSSTSDYTRPIIRYCYNINLLLNQADKILTKRIPFRPSEYSSMAPAILSLSQQSIFFGLSVPLKILLEAVLPVVFLFFLLGIRPCTM